MPKHTHSAQPETRLTKWRFKPSKSGEAGVVKFWWSDGSKTEAETSYLDAIALLKSIQDNGGVPPGLAVGANGAA